MGSCPCFPIRARRGVLRSRTGNKTSALSADAVPQAGWHAADAALARATVGQRVNDHSAVKAGPRHETRMQCCETARWRLTRVHGLPLLEPLVIVAPSVRRFARACQR